LSLLFKVRPEHKYLRVFPPYLLVTLFIELYGTYLFQKFENNVPLYNNFSAFEIFFYLLFLSVIIKGNVTKKAIWIIAPCFLAVALVYINYFLDPARFHSVTFSIGCILIVFFGIRYFFELFRMEKSEGLFTNPAFWIVTGLLFFYSSGFPVYGLVDLWANISPFLRNNFTRIISLMNIFLYGLFTIGFICIRTRKYTL